MRWCPEQSMRIAHITATFPPYYTGTGNVCYHNARVLAQRGHDVHVYTVLWPGVPVDPVGVTVHRLRPLMRLGNAALLPQLRGIGDADIIHLHYPFIFGAEFAALAARRYRTPLVLTYHNDLIAPGARGLFFSLYERSLTPYILGTAHSIYTVSLEQSSNSRALQRVDARQFRAIESVPNGVDIDLFHPSADGAAIRRQLRVPADTTVVAFVGGLDTAHHFKRVDVLINAVASLDDPNVHLLVVGGGDRLQAYQDLASERGIGQRSHFVGWVSHGDLPPYLAASDVLVLPSDSVESFGMVLIEAMACGRPVIASDLPGVGSVVANGVDGLLFRPNDVDDLRRAITLIAADPSRGSTMGQHGRQKAIDLYSWHQIGERFESLYTDVLSESVGGGS
jgi:glycosyltransferase involved in cell wall biosynthesis